MALNYGETKLLIEKVLSFDKATASVDLDTELNKMGRTIQSLYEGVLLHGPKMNFYTSDQWLDSHQKVPHWRMRRDDELMAMLAPRHREMLE